MASIQSRHSACLQLASAGIHGSTADQAASVGSPPHAHQPEPLPEEIEAQEPMDATQKAEDQLLADLPAADHQALPVTVSFADAAAAQAVQQQADSRAASAGQPEQHRDHRADAHEVLSPSPRPLPAACDSYQQGADECDLPAKSGPDGTVMQPDHAGCSAMQHVLNEHKHDSALDALEPYFALDSQATRDVCTIQEQDMPAPADHVSHQPERPVVAAREKHLAEPLHGSQHDDVLSSADGQPRQKSRLCPQVLDKAQLGQRQGLSLLRAKQRLTSPRKATPPQMNLPHLSRQQAGQFPPIRSGVLRQQHQAYQILRLQVADQPCHRSHKALGIMLMSSMMQLSRQQAAQHPQGTTSLLSRQQAIKTPKPAQMHRPRLSLCMPQGSSLMKSLCSCSLARVLLMRSQIL